MSLNTSEPTDQRMVSEIASYIRENRVVINAISGGGDVGVTNLSIAAGITSLGIPADLGAFGLELVIVTGTGVADVATITGGTNGQIKIFIFQDANIDFVDSMTKAGGTFYLNQLPAGSDFEPQQDDILALANVGGNGAATYGYWKEVFRTLSVK